MVESPETMDLGCELVGTMGAEGLETVVSIAMVPLSIGRAIQTRAREVIWMDNLDLPNLSNPVVKCLDEMRGTSMILVGSWQRGPEPLSSPDLCSEPSGGCDQLDTKQVWRKYNGG